MTRKPYLTGHYEPAVDEITATELTVEGSLPPELTGRLLRRAAAAPSGTATAGCTPPPSTAPPT